MSRLRRMVRWLMDHPRAILLPILLLGFALRLARLADQNIWWDEGSSAWQARLSLAEITLYQARDQHPPLYYWLLHYWYTLAGSSLYALRFFSALAGTAGLAVAYLLGVRLLGNSRVALTGALLLAISRFHIEWSQEIKMYAMVSTLSMASLWLAAELAGGRKPDVDGTGRLQGGGEREFPCRAQREVQASDREARWVGLVGLWVPYVLVTVLATYTHYIALLVVAAQNLYVVLWAVRRWRDGHPWWGLTWRWALAQAVVAAICLPWFLLHAQESISWNPTPAQPFAEMLRMVATLLSAGTSLHIERYTVQAVLLWLPVLGTLVPRGNQRQGLAWLWVALIVPWVLTYTLTLPILRLGYESKLAARFFILCQTPFSLLLAWGLHSWQRRWPWSALLGVVIALGILAGPLQSYYAGRYLRDDYATLARTIQAYAQPGEAILLMNDSEWPLFRYTYGGGLPVYQVPYGAVGGEALIKPYIAPAWEAQEALWVVTVAQAREQDPEGAVRAWLTERGHVVLEEQFGERVLTLYSKAGRSLQLSNSDGYRPQYELEQPLEGLLLVGYDQPLSEARTGRSLRLVTTWRIEREEGTLQVQAGLVDRLGRPAGGLGEVATLDTGTGQGARLRARTDIPISMGVGSGRYTMRLFVSSAAGEEVGHLDLGSVRVRQTMGGALAEAQHAVDYRLGESILLRGYDLPREAFRAGDTVRLTLYWQAEDQVGEEYTVFVHLLGEQINPRTGNPLWGQVDRLPVEGKYPTSTWLPGDLVVDRYEVQIDPQTPPGRYGLEIGLYTAKTGGRLPVATGEGRALGDHLILAHIAVR